MESEFFVESFSSKWFRFINIDDLPSLVLVGSIVTVLGVNNNSLTFVIFTSVNIKNFVVGRVYKEFILVLEYLEPSRVGAPNLHVSSSSCTLDIPRLVVVSGSDCLGLLMEIPDLSLSSILCLDDNVSIVYNVKVFSTSQC